MSGLLVAVVGPSGAGKDTLMEAARARLAADPRYAFLRRAVTRPAEAGGEDHLALTEDEFRARRDEGGFALWWQAHGLHYGLPREAVEAALAEGRVAVANLSRRALDEAAERYPLRVVEITAPPALLARRLAARNREDPAGILRRLGREAPLPPGLPVHRVMNDGTVAEGAARVVEALEGALPPHTPPARA